MDEVEEPQPGVHDADKERQQQVRGHRHLVLVDQLFAQALVHTPHGNDLCACVIMALGV